VPDASSLTITPFDKSSIKDIEKALNESDIGINPSNDGQKIRLVIPPMTQVRAAGASTQHML
jgi:ribosome recycling factor